MYCDYHRAAGHLTDNCYTLWDVVQSLIDNRVIVVNPQEAAHTSAPAHPSIANLSSPELAKSEDPGTSGVYLLTPVLADSSSSSMDPADLIDLISSPAFP